MVIVRRTSCWRMPPNDSVKPILVSIVQTITASFPCELDMYISVKTTMMNFILGKVMEKLKHDVILGDPDTIKQALQDALAKHKIIVNTTLQTCKKIASLFVWRARTRRNDEQKGNFAPSSHMAAHHFITSVSIVIHVGGKHPHNFRNHNVIHTG